MERERRRTPRYIFIASAELYEERSDVRVASRVSELSLHGCYLDMMNPFPTGTLVLLKIFAGEMTFQVQGQDRILHAKRRSRRGFSGSRAQIRIHSESVGWKKRRRAKRQTPASCDYFSSTSTI